MNLGEYLDQMVDGVAAAAALGDETTQRTASAVVSLLQPAVRLALIAALTDLAAEVSEVQDLVSVDLRLHGRDVEPVVTPRAGRVGPGGADAGEVMPELPHVDASGTSRISFRLPGVLRGAADAAAAAADLSLDAWLVQAVDRALAVPEAEDGRGLGPRRGRVTGWVTG